MTDRTLDLTSLTDAIASLAAALGVVGDHAWFAEQTPAVRHTLVAGVVQNFEFVYEISVKMIKRRPELDALSPAGVDRANFRELLREAGEMGLIDDVEEWFTYRRMHNITAHTHDHAKAPRISQDIAHFLADARSLAAQLYARNT